MKFVYIQILALIIMVFASCNSPKEKIIEDYIRHYTNMIESDSFRFSNVVSTKSQSFLTEMQTIDQTSPKEVIRFGKAYQVPYTLTQYFVQLNNSHQNSSDENFLKYLSSNAINIFSYFDIYGVSTENTKTGADIFLAVFRNDAGKNKLDWLRLEKENDDYLIDLIYILQIAEQRIMKDLKEGIKDQFDNDLDTFLTDVFERDGTTLMRDAERDLLVKNRQERFAEQFVVK